MNRVLAYTLADMSQIQLQEDASGFVTGSQTFVTHDAPEIKYKMEVVSSYDAPGSCGILLHVLGKLYLLLDVDHNKVFARAYLVDVDKLGYVPNRKTKPFSKPKATREDYLVHLKKGIVAGYDMLFSPNGSLTTWSKVDGLKDCL